MDIYTFSGNFSNTTLDYKKKYLSDVLEYILDKDDLGCLDARYVLDELLSLLQNLESDDYFGTEGWRG